MGPNNLPYVKQQHLGSYSPLPAPKRPRFTQPSPFVPCDCLLAGSLNPYAQSFASRITHVGPLASFGPNSHGILHHLVAKACPLAAVGPVLGAHSAKVYTSPSATPSTLVQDLPTLRLALLAQPPPLSVKACP
jgi:hypothetical protein